MMKGKLKLASNKKSWLLVRDDGKEMQVPTRTLTPSLVPLDPRKHDGLEVEYELDRGQPVRIYEPGAKWEPRPAASPSQPQPRSQPHGDASRSGQVRPPSRQRGESPRHEVRPDRGPLLGDFHNPYNFVPAPPRPIDHPELGDLAYRKLKGYDSFPLGHDRYVPELWSGRIAAKLTTQTPLLILDAAQSELYENDKKRDHKIFPVRLDINGEPYLPPTSVKGMLRSAYEAVTNSRFAIFKHPDRLAYRMPAKIGPEPARVEKIGEEDVLRVMKADVIGFAAKLPRYEERSRKKDKGEGSMALRYPDGTLPQHGDAVWVQINNSRVSRIERRTDGNPPADNWIRGWACVTGPNINKKRYERVFLEDDENDLFIPINDKHKDLWRELIQNYQETHERDLKQRHNKGERPEEYLGDQPGKTGWSRHIYEKGERDLRIGTELNAGTLCYVEFVGDSTNEIAAIIPVTISRRLHSASPDDLLPDSLKPAQSVEQLSPAERIFGWVNQNGSGAYRGNVRIGPVRCVSPSPVEHLKHPGVPLAILGQPKPQQARFYVAQSKRGEAQQDGILKEQAGYLLNKGVRGRKVYPHHAGLPEGYWASPHEDRTQHNDNGFFQEYRRPHEPIIENGRAKLSRQKDGFELKSGETTEQRDDQNRSVRSWVKPKTLFEFQIDVTNLSEVELGGLLWLLSLPDDNFHRLGAGKPLGFGSVRLEIDWDQTDVRRGQAWASFYSTLDGSISSDGAAITGCVQKFQAAIADAYGHGDFDRVSFVAAFKRATKGFEDGKPIHYPRALQPGQRCNRGIPPHPEGRAFEWFVANERTGREGGPKLALPDLESDEGLPILEAR